MYVTYDQLLGILLLAAIGITGFFAFAKAVNRLRGGD
jgi:hypothetical protein